MRTPAPPNFTNYVAHGLRPQPSFQSLSGKGQGGDDRAKLLSQTRLSADPDVTPIANVRGARTVNFIVVAFGVIQSRFGLPQGEQNRIQAGYEEVQMASLSSRYKRWYRDRYEPRYAAEDI